MRTTAPISTRLRRGACAVAATAVLIAGLAACAPEPVDPAPSGTSAAPSPSSTSTASPTPTPTPTATASADDIALPASCDAIYSPAMRAELEANIAPLNDPGVTMPATQNAEALQLLESGLPTLRCTWGSPSERGIATNVSIVDPAATADLAGALANTGFACSEAQGGTVCRLNETLIDYDDNIVEKGESHFFRGNGWVTTVWLDYGPEGYTEDIASMVWG